MSSRDEAAGYAHGWASRADRAATDFLNETYAMTLTEPKKAAYYAGLRDQARDMALMWAAVAQLPEDGVCGESMQGAGLGRPRGFTCVLAPHRDPWHQDADGTRWQENPATIRSCDRVGVHDAHEWTSDGERLGCIGIPEIVLCHSRYQHAEGIAACTREPHHRGGLHEGDGFAWPTSQATEETRHFRCGFCGCAANPAYCDCDHPGDAVPHQRPPSAPS